MRPVFADPKADIIFNKIFGQVAHKDLLIELLNSLLELDDAHRIIDLEYLSPEQLPSRKDLKLSLLDVRCLDAQKTHYVVEMQIIEVEGFQKRVVYNACKTYVNQLGIGDAYPKLNDVVAVTLCNFVLWDRRDPGDGGFVVPMLSRWQLTEQHSGEVGMGDVRYVFLELPKYAAGSTPESTVDKWAYFFASAPSLERIPEVLAVGPWAKALDVARRAGLSAEEETEYEREKMAEQDFRGGLSLAEARGQAHGRLVEARATVEELCAVLNIPLGAERQAALLTMELSELSALRKHLMAHRAWPR